LLKVLLTSDPSGTWNMSTCPSTSQTVYGAVLFIAVQGHAIALGKQTFTQTVPYHH